MKFTDCEPAATEAELDRVEREVGLAFPAALRRLFREANGGTPVCACAEKDGLSHTGVLECLVLSSRDGSALWTYRLFAISKKLFPRNLFPFAVDAGDDCFLVDCSSAAGPVSLFVHDTAFEQLRPLGLTLEQFWDCSVTRRTL